MPLTPGRICLVACYLGPLPGYTRLCFETLGHNPEVNALIAGDALPEGLPPSNVRFLRLSRDALAARFADRLGFAPAIAGRKLCDLKPAYGAAFGDLLQGHDFWGYIDLDLVWGRIADFVDDALLDAHDILSNRTDHLTGHFTLVRNAPATNDLFRKVPFSQETLSDATHFGFDETTTMPDGGKNPLPQPLDLEWARQHGIRPRFYDAVLPEVAAGRLRLSMRAVINEDDPRRTRDMRLRWRDGRLTDERASRDVMYFHLIFAKHTPFFRIPRWNTLPAEFHITHQGVSSAADRTAAGRALFHIERLRRGWWRFLRGIAGNIKRRIHARRVRP